MAEAYYPQYQTHSYYVATGNGGYWQNQSVFVGYRYTHAIVAGFDAEGHLLWDHCFEMENLLSKTLKEKIKILSGENEIVLAYSYNGLINYKIINNQNVIEDKNRIPIKTDTSSDKIKKDYNSEMEYWYGNYFIAYGIQKIKNKDEKNNRTVLYLNKINF